MSDIINELKRAAYVMFKDGWQSPDLAARAGLTIGRLRSENEKLTAEVAALRSQLAAPIPSACSPSEPDRN